MTIFDTLRQEHKLFHQLIDRLEEDSTHPVETVRKDIDRALIVLLMALNRHELIEDLIFEQPAYRVRKGAARLLDQVAAQHKEIKALHADIEKLQQMEKRYDLTKLRSLIFSLCEKLRLHFFTEETSLWPHYNLSMNGSIDRTIHARAQKNVKNLQDEIKAYSAAVEDYV